MSRNINPETYLSTKMINHHKEVYNTKCDEELLQCHLNNFLYNIGILHLYPGIYGFEGIFKKVPAVIVGAGPSLTKQLPLLKKYKDKMLIVALDAALPILVKKLKIYPHFVVMGDPTEKQVYNFTNIDTTKFYTIASSVTHPAVFRKVDPRHMAVYHVKSNSPITEIIPYHAGRKGGMPAGVLSSGSAFNFAGVMGCTPITFIGHDLSWPTPDKVYAEGVVKGKHSFQKAAKFKGDCLLFPDINSNLVLTHETFLNFYFWMVSNAKQITTRIFNSSEAGILRSKEIRPMKFKDWTNKYCKQELVGVEEASSKAWNWEHKDGLLDKIFVPPRKDKTRVVQNTTGGF